MMYRNINTGELWTLEEIKSEYEKFKHETSLTFEETMKDFEEAEPIRRRTLEEIKSEYEKFQHETPDDLRYWNE